MCDYRSLRWVRWWRIFIVSNIDIEKNNIASSGGAGHIGADQSLGIERDGVIGGIVNRNGDFQIGIALINRRIAGGYFRDGLGDVGFERGC
ncbi:MAG TPA: hypothetical protein PKN61_15515 [Acidobacteriota bacterium]|nr:hypothetical protein [Acidobacteriota bacterium]HNU00962.1 hypothetical protein [Acidobacteriota bacterium]